MKCFGGVRWTHPLPQVVLTSSDRDRHLPSLVNWWGRAEVLSYGLHLSGRGDVCRVVDFVKVA